MTKSLHIISANNLRDGLNVYYMGDETDGGWDTDIAKATIYDAESMTPAFERAKRDMADNIVVDCLTLPVDENHTPLTTRERIRAAGPSTPYGHQV